MTTLIDILDLLGKITQYIMIVIISNAN